MKYVKTTLIDSRTEISTRYTPARNGSTINKGIERIFIIESTLVPSIQPWATPDIYGVITDESYYEELLSLPHVTEVDEKSFWEVYKQELIDRAKEKKWQVEMGGIYIGDMFIETAMHDQQRIHSAYTGLAVIGDGTVDFSTPEGSVQLTAQEIEGLFFSVATHVQECFSWQANIINNINSLELTLDNYQEKVPSILEAIAEFGSHITPPEEDVGEEIVEE